MLKYIHSTAWRFIRETRSDTALEFAMIGTAFFLCIFGIFVVSIDQFWQMTLDDAVRNAARQVQIGNVTSGPQFVTTVCNEFGVAAPYCATTLQYSVQSGTYFGALTPAVLSADGTLSPSNSFSAILSTAPQTTNTQTTVGVSQYLLVQVTYLLPFKVMLLPMGVATENGTPALFSAVATPMEN